MQYSKQYSVEWTEETYARFAMSHPREGNRRRVIAQIAREMGFPIDHEDILWVAKRCLRDPKLQASWRRYQKLVKCKESPKRLDVEYYLSRIERLLPEIAAERDTPWLFDDNEFLSKVSRG